MSDYWYTDEYGRKRHVQDSISSNGHNTAHYRHESINSSFYGYGGFSKDSYLCLTSCPKCFEAVYYCNCSNGGRVFFDSLAPDWEKHPCTSTPTYKPKNIDEKYSLIIPKHNYYQHYEDYERRSTAFEVPSFLKIIKINTTDDILYKNLTEYSMILIREANNRFYLTIIVTSKQFNNKHLCTNKRFNNQHTLKEYIVSLLSSVDLSKSIDILNEIIYTKDNKKIIKINKLQSVRIKQLTQSRKKPKKPNSKVKKKKKQEFKPIEQIEYISKNTGLKIKKKKNANIANEATKNISIQEVEKMDGK